jgi:hypothetical protein
METLPSRQLLTATWINSDQYVDIVMDMLCKWQINDTLVPTNPVSFCLEDETDTLWHKPTPEEISWSNAIKANPGGHSINELMDAFERLNDFESTVLMSTNHHVSSDCDMKNEKTDGLLHALFGHLTVKDTNVGELTVQFMGMLQHVFEHTYNSDSCACDNFVEINKLIEAHLIIPENPIKKELLPALENLLSVEIISPTQFKNLMAEVFCETSVLGNEGPQSLCVPDLTTDWATLSDLERNEKLTDAAQVIASENSSSVNPANAIRAYFTMIDDSCFRGECLLPDSLLNQVKPAMEYFMLNNNTLSNDFSKFMSMQARLFGHTFTQADPLEHTNSCNEGVCKEYSVWNQIAFRPCSAPIAKATVLEALNEIKEWNSLAQAMLAKLA